VNPAQPPATLRGAVDLPLTPVRYRRTLDQQLAAPPRISPIQLAPDPTPTVDPAKPRRTRAARGQWSHGTINGYTTHKCRCDLCGGAWREYRRGQRRELGATS